MSEIPVTVEPVDPPPVVDPAAFRAERAREVLARVIPAQFADARPDHPAVIAWVSQFIADPSGVPSMLLAGPTGSGKTFQGYAAVRAVVEGLAAKGQRVDWRVTSQPVLSDALRPKPDQSHATALDPLIAADLLMLDDLGAGKQSDWNADALYRLVDARWSHKRPTIYTTNLDRAQLIDAVGDRIVSRLADARRVAILGEDRRWVNA